MDKVHLPAQVQMRGLFSRGRRESRPNRLVLELKDASGAVEKPVRGGVRR